MQACRSATLRPHQASFDQGDNPLCRPCATVSSSSTDTSTTHTSTTYKSTNCSTFEEGAMVETPTQLGSPGWQGFCTHLANNSGQVSLLDINQQVTACCVVLSPCLACLLHHPIRVSCVISHLVCSACCNATGTIAVCFYTVPVVALVLPACTQVDVQAVCLFKALILADTVSYQSPALVSLATVSDCLL